MGGGSSQPQGEVDVGGTQDTTTSQQEETPTSGSPKHVVMLFGPPGAGKGTHSPYIEKCLNVPVLSTGAMLREAVASGTGVGKRAKEIMESGGLVPDQLVMDIISEAIKPLDNGFMLDGFPRTVEQNHMFDQHLEKSGLTVSAVFYFSVPDHVLEERILGRWVHKKSGRSYHETNAKPKSLLAHGEGAVPSPENMLDDHTNEPLTRRNDDTAESLKKRLEAYHAQTRPILDFYRGRGAIREINCHAPIDEVQLELERHVAQLLGVELSPDAQPDIVEEDLA